VDTIISSIASHYKLIFHRKISFISIIIPFLIIILFSVSTASAIYHNVEIIESSNEGIHFKINIDSPYDYIHLNREDSSILMQGSILIGLPPGKTAVLESVQGGMVRPLHGINGFKPAMISNSIVETGKIKKVRGARLLTVNVYPLQNNQYYSSIEVSISFEGARLPGQENILSSFDPRFDRILKYSLLNYDQFRNWPSEAEKKPAYKPGQHPFDFSNQWYKIGVSTDGFKKITGADLAAAGAVLSGIDIDEIRIFYGGGKPLPVENAVDRPDFLEIAARIYDDGDGVFESNDSLIFYAENIERWIYPSDSNPYYSQHPYAKVNYYWLNISGLIDGEAARITAIDGSPSAADYTEITTGKYLDRIEQNNMLLMKADNKIDNYFTWYWTDTTSFSFFNATPNRVPGIDANIRLRAVADTLTVRINGAPQAPVSRNRDYYYYNTSNLNGSGLNTISITLDSNLYPQSAPYFDFYEIEYTGYLIPTSDDFGFYIEGIDGVGRINVNDNFSTAPMIFELSDPLNPLMIENAQSLAGSITFELSFVSGEYRRLYMATASEIKNVASITKTSLRNIRAQSEQNDLIIIAPETLIPSLENYENYREAQSGINAARFSFEDIIDEFSYGVYDPTAIRDFLKFAYENFPSPVPSAVLLIGDGVYDYKNYMTSINSLLPPFLHPLDYTASDDNYVYFGNFGLLDSDSSYCDTCTTRGYDMLITRWPVKTAGDIATIVNKIMTYESASNFGAWRSRITLVADDEYAGADDYEHIIHTRQTEILQNYHLPGVFQRDKIYLWEYEYNSEGNKPEVNDAIINSINDGTLLVNYVGHGNPDTWAHEHVLNRTTDLQKMTNADRLTLIFTASCSIGFFDNPEREGMAEDFLRMPTGAIGVVAATRLVYSNENAFFNRQVFDIMFGSPELSIGEAFYTSKLIRQYSTSHPENKINDRKFAYFGDPYLKLGIPKYDVAFTEYPDTLTALAPHHVEGRILDKSSGLVNFNGTARVTIFDTDIEIFHKGIYVNDTITYAKDGPIIYRGGVEVTNGHFDFSFIAPVDIGYGGRGARLFAYVYSEQADAFGVADSLVVSSNIADLTDSTGPTIDYTFSERNKFISGDIITADETLVLNMSDSSGVNLTGGTGHGITLTIDNNVENQVDLTDLFQYNTGSYTSGQLRYELADLSVGNHSFKLKAWDNANNSATVEFDAEVVASGQFMLTEVLNYPNPMEEQTMFSFVLTSPANRVTLEIFTLAGRKIFYYVGNSLNNDFHEFFSWDGRDYDGDRVATGVYIYKVTAYAMETDEVAESFGKVVVVN